jgi:hypothetical protein
MRRGVDVEVALDVEVADGQGTQYMRGVDVSDIPTVTETVWVYDSDAVIDLDRVLEDVRLGDEVLEDVMEGVTVGMADMEDVRDREGLGEVVGVAETDGVGDSDGVIDEEMDEVGDKEWVGLEVMDRDDVSLGLFVGVAEMDGVGD